MTANKFYNTKKNKFFLSNDNIFYVAINRVLAKTNNATVFIPHVCNNIDGYGAGFAAQVSDKFPIAKQNYHMLGKPFLSKNLGYSQIVKVLENKISKNALYIVNMIAQNGLISYKNPRPLNYGSLVKSMNNLNLYINSNTGFLKKTETIEIHCHKFGSGLAGGNWNFISDLIDDIWGHYHIVVYNYNNKKL